MTLGLTGNPEKDALWVPLARLVGRLRADGAAFVIDPRLATGLATRALADSLDGFVAPIPSPGAGAGPHADVVLSFGGDGTMLRTAHAVGRAETPILGVNVGRLGFLADVETGELDAVVARLRAGDFRVEARTVLEATLVEGTPQRMRGEEAPNDGAPPLAPWALNEFAVERAGRAAHRVHLVKLPERPFFATLRSKLLWGRGVAEG